MDFKNIDAFPPAGTSRQNNFLLACIGELQAAVAELEARLARAEASVPAGGVAGPLASPEPPPKPEWSAEERELLESVYGVDFLRVNSSTEKAMRKHGDVLGGIPSANVCHEMTQKLALGRHYDTRELMTVWMLNESKTKASRYFIDRAKMAQYKHPLGLIRLIE